MAGLDTEGIHTSENKGYKEGMKVYYKKIGRLSRADHVNPEEE